MCGPKHHPLLPTSGSVGPKKGSAANFCLLSGYREAQEGCRQQFLQFKHLNGADYLQRRRM